MSQENVELARRWLEALSGDSEDFDRALAVVHHDVVFVPPGEQARTGALRTASLDEPDAFPVHVVKAFEPVVVRDRTGETTHHGPRSGQRDRDGCPHLGRLDL